MWACCRRIWKGSLQGGPSNKLRSWADTAAANLCPGSGGGWASGINSLTLLSSPLLYFCLDVPWAEPNDKPEGKRTSTASPERPTPWKEQVGEGWRVDAEGVPKKAQAERV